MHFNPVLLLSLASTLISTTSAVAIPEPFPFPEAGAVSEAAAAVTRYAFNLYPNANCGGKAVPQSGTGQDACRFPNPATKIASVLVTYNDRCIIVFGKGQIPNSIDCGGNQTTSPGLIQQNACYTFPANRVPTQFNTLCHS